jgi:hypothetical protein
VLTEDRLTVFVPGELVNPLNAREHRMRRYARERRERDATHVVLYAALTANGWRITVSPERPKAITFVGHVRRRFDVGDNLPACFKAHRDALVGLLLHQDGPRSGHTFTYDQVVDGRRGVEITVRLA